MNVLVYLAAGNSRRFGEQNKLLHTVQGKPMFLHGLAALLAVLDQCEDCKLLVVTRFRVIGDVVQSLAQTRGDVQLVWSPQSKKGIAYSIHAAIEAAQPIAEEDKLLFQVADQPQIQTQTILQVLNKGAHAPLACAAHGKRLGNPTLFSAQYLPELLALGQDKGGKHVLLAHIEQCARVEVQDAQELCDIDRPDALMPQA